MTNPFKEKWADMHKTHDVKVQEKLDEAKEDVHEMDEQLDNIEEESKPGAEAKKSDSINHGRNAAKNKVKLILILQRIRSLL